MRDRWRRRISDESGLSLVELLVYVVLLGVVMSVVGSLYATTLRTESQIRTTSEAVRAAQLVSDSVTTGIRNSSRFDVTVPRSGDQLLMAKVAAAQGEVPAWRCVAWYYSASSTSLRSTELSSPFTAPTASELATWPLIATGISPPSGATSIFTATEAQLAFGYNISASGTAPINISTAAVSRAGTSGASPCS